MNKAFSGNGGWVRLVAWGICAAPLAVLAGGPATAPVAVPIAAPIAAPTAPTGHPPLHAGQERPPGREGHDSHDGPEARTWRRFGPNGLDDPAAWEEASEFMKVHCPNRFSLLQKLDSRGARGQQLRGFRGFIIKRYEKLQSVKQESPALYDLQVKHAELEDQIFGFCSQLKTASGSQRDALRDSLKQVVASRVDNRLQQRQVRIENLQKLLDQQKHELESQTSQRDAMVEKQFQLVFEQGVEGARLGHGRASDDEAAVHDSPSSAPAE